GPVGAHAGEPTPAMHRRMASSNAELLATSVNGNTLRFGTDVSHAFQTDDFTSRSIDPGESGMKGTECIQPPVNKLPMANQCRDFTVFPLWTFSSNAPGSERVHQCVIGKVPIAGMGSDPP